MQVTNVALQTDSCDTLYISKNTLAAYTIAIVQNAQALQYDQMHVALQTARNQASLEMPLRAEELMTAHFNLAVLSNETDINKTSDAQKPEDTTIAADPSTSTADEQTYVKIPSWHYAANCDPKKQYPTEPSLQPVEETTDLLMEYQQVTRLMTLGTTILILMSTHIHTT